MSYLSNAIGTKQIYMNHTGKGVGSKNFGAGGNGKNQTEK